MTQNITEVKEEVWEAAQKLELQCWANEPQDADDWNMWWKAKFMNYSFLTVLSKAFHSIYEVGCGPYAKNLDHVIGVLGRNPTTIVLSDPLLESYLILDKSVSRFKNDPNVTFVSEAMEKFSLKDLNIEPVDLLICNNVLDHVQSVEKCFEHINSSLQSGGYFIFGQDLTSLEDVQAHPDLNDPMHPIRLDEEALLPYLENFNKVFYKVLPREEGRNPEHHYGTMLFIGMKK